MKTNYLKLSFGLVLLSFFIHIYLASSHYSFKYGAGEGKSICSINETLNCEAVSISKYSYLFEKPLAVWGMGFHFAFLVLFFFLLRTSGQDGTVRFLRTMALLSFLTSVVMSSISFTQMTTYCIFCIALHILALLTFLLLMLANGRPFFANGLDIQNLFKGGDTGYRNFLIALLAIPLMAFFIDDMWKKNYSEVANFLIQDGLSGWDRSPSHTFEKPLLVKGNPATATFRIVEFADFMCPHCQHAVHVFDSFLKAHPNTSLEFYVFPLDSQCNPAVGSGNGQRCLLAKAVFCAKEQSLGWQAHQWIFDRLGSQDQFDLSKMKQDLKLTDSGFDSCITSELAANTILENAKVGQEAKVDSTPSVFVNDKKLGYGNTVPVLEALYKKLNLQ